MGDDSTARQVHQAFTRLMRWAHRGDVRRSLAGSTADTLSMNDLTLLRAVTAHGPVRISDLASWQGVDKSTVTPQVRRLEDRHLVERHGDPADRRATLLTVTDHGRRHLDNMDDVGEDLFARALDGWSGDDRRTLAELMRRLADELAVIPHESVLRTRRTT
ncbi:MarR family winged helix-turn-helix transcriptional regulator [Paractinoplanes atraurantiacus]|uniref:DNA-binding transcriptional regulator, MarR family n=1 Tax=Paractinoplanes atraurantiacus TaxID=1036182 RepID=A0A285GNJ6_9ACTN|nr:MarR family winged helix-turn-helix transcriptional regulator [Actinoplanes atraurantiacus]SNY24873.1 DNA-binding transcriptional regulator, MarR family [Actinoplanes atraurantiacus]